jgi:hypothetical protein
MEEFVSMGTMIPRNGCRDARVYYQKGEVDEN